jgi:predicted Zn-dependent peptidase
MKFTKKILKNGLRVITVPMQDNPAVTVFVMVEAGAKYETKEINGISHFLEHMVFKGTPRRPKATDIAREFDGLGADYNAFTGDEYTGYYVKVDKRHTDTALDIISDMYLNPLFPESEIVKEKGVIIEEIRMYRDRPDRQVAEAISELLYPGQPAGWTILGPEENIRSFSRKDFIAYREKHYVASATTVVIAGAIDEKDVTKKVEKIFSEMSVKPKKGKRKVVESQKSPQLKVLHKDTDQTHLVIALRTFAVTDKRNPIMRVLSAVLGRGMSSRLFSKMRDDLGICYYVRSSHNTYTDHGFFDISAGVDTSRVELAIETILDELKRLKDELVSDAELKKAKDYIAGTMMLNLETSDSKADFVAHQEIMKKNVKTPEEMVADVNKVTAAEIQELAKEFFTDKGLNLAIIGPYKDEARFVPVLKFKKK